MTTKTTFFKGYDRKGQWSVEGNYKTSQEILNKINADYNLALSRGYDNRHEKFSIVCVTVEVETNDNGDLIRRTTSETIVNKVEFSDESNKFVNTCFEVL